MIDPRRGFRLFVSPRTTVVLLCLLSVLLLLNVVLPQQSALGRERFEEITGSGAWTGFVLAKLGLGRMPTSPLFLGVLVLFFVNLVAVLATRVGPTLRRVSPGRRSERGLVAWARLEESLRAALPGDWSAGHVAKTLATFGYQVRRPGERTVWAVKHRTAPLGFLLFHVSFLLVCAGGALIYTSRFVGSAVLSEGQEFQGEYSEIERTPPLGQAPPLRFTLERVETRFERGEPVHLGAVLRFPQAERRARVNHPARWGSTRLLINQAGLAPVLWLQDARGFTRDRVVVPVRASGRRPTDVALGDGGLAAFVHPLEQGAGFPAREALAGTALRVQVTEEGRVVFDGLLRPGEAATLEAGRLVLEELRLWARVRVIAERGSGLLVAGFAVGILGLIWRMLLFRREVALTWDDREFKLVGRAEYFTWRFQQELEAIRFALSGESRG